VPLAGFTPRVQAGHKNHGETFIQHGTRNLRPDRRLYTALYTKDSASAIAPLADDAVTFDLAPPLQLGPKGAHDPVRLENWLATCKGPIVSKPGERTIVVDDNVAYAYGLQRMTGTKTNGEKSSFGSVQPPASAAITGSGGLLTCITPCPSRWMEATKRCLI
jgi:ketosteroid isomerase-like protein